MSRTQQYGQRASFLWLHGCQRNQPETVSGAAGATQLNLEKAPSPPPRLPVLTRLRQAGHFWRQSIHNPRQLWSSTFCFVQSQHGPGKRGRKAPRGGLWGREHAGANPDGHLLWTQQQTARWRPAPRRFDCGPCLDPMPGASREGFLLPTGACTPGTRHTPVQGREAFVSSRSLPPAGEEVTVGTELLVCG